MHRIIRTKAYEAKHGPHFDEEHARKAVSKMENEDGSRGQHWSVQVRELKDLIKQAINMVPPQMKQMLPQNMQKAMNEAS